MVVSGVGDGGIGDAEQRQKMVDRMEVTGRVLVCAFPVQSMRSKIQGQLLAHGAHSPAPAAAGVRTSPTAGIHWPRIDLQGGCCLDLDQRGFFCLSQRRQGPTHAQPMRNAPSVAVRMRNIPSVAIYRLMIRLWT